MIDHDESDELVPVAEPARPVGERKPAEAWAAGKGMLPDVVIQIQDGALGQTPASVANAQAKVGICSDGIVGQVYSFSDIGGAQQSLGQGPLVDAIAHTLAVAGGPVYAIPANPSTYGS